MQQKAKVDEMSAQASGNQQEINTRRNEQLTSGDCKSISRLQWSPHCAVTATNGNVRILK